MTTERFVFTFGEKNNRQTQYICSASYLDPDGTEDDISMYVDPLENHIKSGIIVKTRWFFL